MSSTDTEIALLSLKSKYYITIQNDSYESPISVFSSQIVSKPVGQDICELWVWCKEHFSEDLQFSMNISDYGELVFNLNELTQELILDEAKISSFQILYSNPSFHNGINMLKIIFFWITDITKGYLMKLIKCVSKGIKSLYGIKSTTKGLPEDYVYKFSEDEILEKEMTADTFLDTMDNIIQAIKLFKKRKDALIQYETINEAIHIAAKSEDHYYMSNLSKFLISAENLEELAKFCDINIISDWTDSQEQEQGYEVQEKPKEVISPKEKHYYIRPADTKPELVTPTASAATTSTTPVPLTVDVGKEPLFSERRAMRQTPKVPIQPGTKFFKTSSIPVVGPEPVEEDIQPIPIEKESNIINEVSPNLTQFSKNNKDTIIVKDKEIDLLKENVLKNEEEEDVFIETNMLDSDDEEDRLKYETELQNRAKKKS